MARIVTVCKDVGGANMVIPLVEQLVSAGHEVFPIVEGLATEQWPGTREMRPVFAIAKILKTPFLLNPVGALQDLEPDVVLVGTGFPNNLEGRFADMAAYLKIPAVVVEDFWGSCSRLGFKGRSPNLLLAIDEYAARIAGERYSGTTIVITGNPGVRETAKPALRARTLRSTGVRIITFCGGGPETTEQIHLLLQCLEKTSGNWKLVPRWHPKVAELLDPENGNRPYREVWDGMLAKYGDQVLHLDEDTTESVVAGSKVVVAGFSTLLSTAASEGIAAAVLETPGVLRALEEESGLTEVPHIALGVAERITGPVDLAKLRPCSAEARGKLIPFDPEIGAKAIHDLLIGR